MHSNINRGVILSAILLLTWSASIAAPPLPSPPATAADTRPLATFTFADASQVATRSSSGRFRLVAIRPSETVSIALFLPNISWGSSPPPLSMDGGTILSVSTSSAVGGGLAVIRFQAGSKPGLYRVLLPSINLSARLQFWVQAAGNPNPAMSAVVVNPQHWSAQ